MSEEQQSYRQIFKATSIFGGVQVFNIIITIIRSKVVAILLGPTGMGIINLLVSTTGFISSLTNFGLGTSAVKSVAAASGSGDEVKVSLTVTVLRRLVRYTGLLGTVLTAILSPILSKLAFGTKDYTFAFVWISITLLFQQISSGQLVVLQGLRKLKDLARANLTGSLFGLIISLPIYYLWKLEGIIPVIISSSFISMLFSWYFAGKTKIKSVHVVRKTILAEGKEMMGMGLMINLSTLIAVGISILVKIYLRKTGGVEFVGLYSAGFAIINTYVGAIFLAMSTDYYPRLSAIASDFPQARRLISQQAESAVLILAPILAIFLIYINFIIVLLYSQKFSAIDTMIQWAALGMYFKAASWAIVTFLLAKGVYNIFFMNELVSSLYLLGLNVVGFKLGGLEGLGMSFFVAYFIYFIQVFLIAKMKYSFSFESIFYKIAGLQIIISLLCFGISRFFYTPWNYFIGSILIIISVLYSLNELNKRIEIKGILKKVFNRVNRK